MKACTTGEEIGHAVAMAAALPMIFSKSETKERIFS
jgi:hypothetical protein